MPYATLADVKLYRGIEPEVDDDDALLSILIERAQAAIDRHTGRTFEALTASTMYFDAVRDVSEDRRTLYLDDDLCGVVSIVNGSGRAVTDYVTVPRNHTPYREIRIKASADELWTYEDDPEDAIAISGYWAYSMTPPADIQQATIRLATYMYVQKDASSFDVTAYPDMGMMQVPQGMPRDVRETLDRYVRLR